MRVIRFKFAAEKARAAIHHMVWKKPGIDLHTMLKACYFADKKHLNEELRPVFGANYRAMKFGPVPLEIYEMAKGESLWLAELSAERFPWELSGYRLNLHSNTQPDLDSLSETDNVALEDGLATSSAMSFSARTAITHGQDWQSAELGFMRYEDMLDETSDKEDRIQYLLENARFMRL